MVSYLLKGDISSPNKRISLPWAVVILIILALPLNFYLGKWNFPTWVCFIVWAEYFALGANIDTWKLIIPSIPFGAGVGAAWCTSAVFLTGILVPILGPLNGAYAGYAITSIFWIAFLVYGLAWSPSFTGGTLAVFNGFSLQLAIYFTGTIPEVGPMNNPYYVIWWGAVWTILMGWLGWIFGWFNVVLTFPREPDSN